MLPDEDIDTSDIPQLTTEQLRGAVRGQFYRPMKRPVTIRLDTDVIAWLKQNGPRYQTTANALLRREMIRSLHSKKGPERATTSRRSGKRIRSR